VVGIIFCYVGRRKRNKVHETTAVAVYMAGCAEDTFVPVRIIRTVFT
jgi:hypothetical protein